MIAMKGQEKETMWTIIAFILAIAFIVIVIMFFMLGGMSSSHPICKTWVGQMRYALCLGISKAVPGLTCGC